jgi:adenylate cyclase
MTDVTSAVRTSETDAISRLLSKLNAVESQFRQQRSQLQRQGMSLPPGTLLGLQQIRSDLESLSEAFAATHTELHRLRELSRTAEVINSTLDLDSVLNEVMDTVILLTRAERGYLMLRNPETGALDSRVARNFEHRTLSEHEFIISSTVTAEAARTGQPVLTTNAGQDPRFQAQMSIVNFALRSILCVPLLLKGAVTGVIYADNRIKQGLFGDKELELLQTFANQAAVAIENARLYERLQSSLAEITAMKDLLANVFASIASGVITTDSVNRITVINEAACRILNLSAEACLDQPLPAIWPLIQAETLAAVRREGLEETVEVDAEVEGRGILNLSLHLSPLRSSTGQIEGVAIVVDDLTEMKRREAQLNVVRRYLPPAMVDNIQSIDRLGLGGERRTVTTIFIDVRGFHTFPPGLPPQDLMVLLNRHLTIASDAVSQQTGVIDKYMANEIMGLFNTQLNPADDHAWRALLAALNMAEEYAQFARQSGEPNERVYFRIGIHTGEATLGNVGGEHRREFTAIGDAVNLAHRLLENAGPGQIVISEDTLRACQPHMDTVNARLGALVRERLQVKGRSEATWAYRITRSPGKEA